MNDPEIPRPRRSKFLERENLEESARVGCVEMLVIFLMVVFLGMVAMLLADPVIRWIVSSGV